MSFRIVSPALYVCDGCGAKAMGWLDELPEGWKLASVNESDNWEAKVAHLCPECAVLKQEP